MIGCQVSNTYKYMEVLPVINVSNIKWLNIKTKTLIQKLKRIIFISFTGSNQ